MHSSSSVHVSICTYEYEYLILRSSVALSLIILKTISLPAVVILISTLMYYAIVILIHDRVIILPFSLCPEHAIPFIPMHVIAMQLFLSSLFLPNISHSYISLSSQCHSRSYPHHLLELSFLSSSLSVTHTPVLVTHCHSHSCPRHSLSLKLLSSSLIVTHCHSHSCPRHSLSLTLLSSSLIVTLITILVTYCHSHSYPRH